MNKDETASKPQAKRKQAISKSNPPDTEKEVREWKTTICC